MAKILEWGPMTIEVSQSKIVPLRKLSTALVRKSDTASDTSGTPTSNVRGMELQEITISTTYLSAAGVDPRAELERWKELFGQRYPLYINGSRFGPPQLELDSVDIKDIVPDNQGRFLRADLDITLVEYSPQDVPPPAAASSTAAAPAGSREQAVQAKPPTAAKAQAKPAPKRSRTSTNPSTGKPVSVKDRPVATPVIME